jgi:hypothetical protein
LSGDVHHSYTARAELPGVPAGAARVHQVVCSPVHNHVPGAVRAAFRLAWSRPAAAWARAWAAHHDAPAPGPVWDRVGSPLFGNHIATLLVDGRRAEVIFEQPRSAAALDERARVTLSAEDHA